MDKETEERTWPRQTVQPVHFNQCTLLVGFVSKPETDSQLREPRQNMESDLPNESVPSRDASDWVQHDLGTLAAKEGPNETGFSVVSQAEHGIAEDGDKIRVGDLGGQVADEDAVLLRILRVLRAGYRDGGRIEGDGQRCGRDGRRPVHGERLRRVRHRERVPAVGAVDMGEHGCGVNLGWEREEAVARIVRLAAGDGVWCRTRDLDVDWVPTHEVADLLGVFFVHPGFEFAPPKGRAWGIRGAGRGDGAGLYVGHGRRGRRLVELAGEEGVTEGVSVALRKGGGRRGGSERGRGTGRGCAVVVVVEDQLLGDWLDLVGRDGLAHGVDGLLLAVWGALAWGTGR